jgi:hypothetical protein
VTAPMLDGQDEWGPWYRRIGGQAISGETLLEGPEGDPLLVLSRQGQGRAAILLSDQAWLWARGYEGGGPHDELFRRTADGMEIEVNPRYGTYDPGTFEIDPAEQRLSRPDSGI